MSAGRWRRGFGGRRRTWRRGGAARRRRPRRRPADPVRAPRHRLSVGEKRPLPRPSRFSASLERPGQHGTDALFLLLRGSVVLRAGVDVRGGRRLAPPAAFGLEALAGLGERRLGARLEGAVAAEPSLIARINKADFVGSLEHTRAGRAAVV